MQDAWKSGPVVRRFMSGLSVIAAMLTASATASPSFGQDDGAPRSTRDLIDDFSHFVFIANLDAAEGYANALLERGIAPQEFLATLEDAPELERRFEDAYRRALAIPQLEDEAAQLWQLYEEGRRSRARMPEEIARNIQLLTGNRRAELLARERLMSAGEHAVPQLLEVLLSRQNPQLEGKVMRLLVDMGRDSVAPLTASLLAVDPDVQEKLARVLGQIPYRTSLPFLYELHQSTTTENVKAASKRAIENIDGSFDAGMSVGRLYGNLAQAYYDESPSLLGFADERFQMLWDFMPGVGLNRTAILTEVFFEARAMALAERAMALDPGDREALSLWLASNLRRELKQPEGYENPAYPPSRRDAMYFAVAAGSGPMQHVLSMAMADRNTRLARRAIEALSQSASGVGLWGTASDERPLVDALSYPDRRVQYEAALALGRANPATSFPGADRVVPILASAIREAANRYAVVLATDVERQQEIRTWLEGVGYIVLPPGRGLGDVQAAMADTPGIDLMVTELTPDRSMDVIREARRSSRLGATPLVAVMSAAGSRAHGAEIENDSLTRFAREGLNEDQMLNVISDLMAEASGPAVTEDEAKSYAMASLDRLSSLAVSGSSVYDVSDAAVPLMAALNETMGEVRLRVAEVLSRIDQKRVQVSLMDAALDATGDEQLALLEIVTDSAKRFGNLLDRRQVQELIDLAETGLDEEATAAAALMGTLNLSNDSLLPLILEGQ